MVPPTDPYFSKAKVAMDDNEDDEYGVMFVQDRGFEVRKKLSSNVLLISHVQHFKIDHATYRMREVN